jgi:molybdopterin synthase catalytic subunit
LIKVQQEDFDVGAEIGRLTEGNAKVGGLSCFVGLVRDIAGSEKIASMTLEHYPGMTERSIEAIIHSAKARWNIYDVLVIHRVGRLLPCDQIVLVIVTSAHRGDAFAACEFLMDYLKTRAPFWKKEELPGSARWVDARQSDDAAAARWEKPAT